MLAKLTRLFVALSITALSGTALAGCYDGSIEINFDPQADGVDLTSFRIIVYAEATGEISCDALSFDEIPLDVLETTKVFEGTTEPGVPIQVSGVPRKGKKLFFAEASVETGVSIFAGCEELGEITGPTIVNIEPTLRTNSSFDSELVIRSGDGAGQIAPVDVTVLFLNGLPLPGSPVRWRLRGASPEGLFESSGDVTTAGAMGRARIAFTSNQIPTARGPVELRIKTRWAQSPAPPLLGFLNPSVREAQVAADASVVAATTRSADILEVGTLNAGERPSIVVLASEAVGGGGRGETSAYVFQIAGDGNGASLDPVDAISVGETVGGTAARTLGKIAGDVDQIIAIWQDTGGLVATDIATPASQVGAPFAGIPIKLSAGGGCATGEDNVIVAQLADDRSAIQWTTKNLNGIQDVALTECDLRPTSDLIEIGCVRDTLDTYRSAFVFDKNEDGASSLLETFRPSLGVGNPQSPGFTCGEIPADATTVWIGDFSPEAEGTMLIGEQTDEGPATTRYLLQPIKSAQSNEIVGMSADFQGADPTPLSVIATAEGDVNGDLETDVVSLIALGRGDNGIEVAIHVSMAIPGSLDRLRGTMTDSFDAIGPRLRVADLNEDGVDDIVLGSTDILRVYLMGPI